MVAHVRTTLFIALSDPATFSRANERALEADDMARSLIEDFCHRAMFKTPQSHQTVKWLADSLRSVLNHEYPQAPLRSFGLLPRSKGKPQDETRPFDVAAWVLVAMRRGYTKAEAKEMAASAFDIDLKQVERHIREQALTPESLNPDEALWDSKFNAQRPDDPARPLPKPKAR